jgi:hypothetical protein
MEELLETNGVLCAEREDHSLKVLGLTATNLYDIYTKEALTGGAEINEMQFSAPGVLGSRLRGTGANAAGFDLNWFGVLTVVAVEGGLLTPPFGLSAYTTKSAMDDPDAKAGEIFRGAFPFILAMLVSLARIIAFPSAATWLARLEQNREQIE